MKKFLVAVECILEYANKILMIKRPPGVHAAGLLSFPGGAVEYKDGENEADILTQAIKREVLEEVGLELQDPITLITTSHFIDVNGNPILDAIFYSKLEKTVINIKPSPREVPEYFWLTREEISKHDCSPPWIKRYLNMVNY